MRTPKLLLALAYGLLIASCQSTPKEPPVAAAATPPVAEAKTMEAPAPAPATPAPESAADRIEVSRDGFSPLASPPNHRLSVSLTWGDPSHLTEWAVVFQADGQTPVRTIRGTTAVPLVEWDGTTDAGVLAPQDRYRAILQTIEGGSLVERARTQPFLLDLVPPSGTITVAPQPFVPGPADVLVNPPTMTIGLNLVPGAAPWATWRLAVLHPDGRRFKDFISEDHRDNQVVWDGRAINNARLEAGTTYRLEAEVFDIYGNRGLVTGSLVVQAPPTPVPAPVASPPPEPAPAAVPVPTPAATTVTVAWDGKVLAELPVYFPPYSSDLGAVTGTQKASNDRALAELAKVLAGAPGKAIRIVGHANQVLFYDAAKAAYEQKETLIPLSLARAEAVKRALTERGIPGPALTTAGVGAADPVAAFDDAVNRWKNRRVVLEAGTGDGNN